MSDRRRRGYEAAPVPPVAPASMDAPLSLRAVDRSLALRRRAVIVWCDAGPLGSRSSAS
jgi:hypothetical protein